MKELVLTLNIGYHSYVMVVIVLGPADSDAQNRAGILHCLGFLNELNSEVYLVHLESSGNLPEMSDRPY